MFAPTGIDPLAVRRQFSRRARNLAQADFLLRHVEQQMFERLDLVKAAPQRVVDLGCGLGEGLLNLRRRFPQAQTLGIDVSHAVLREARQRTALPATSRLGQWLDQLRSHLLPDGLARASVAPLASLVCADATELPLAGNSVDLIWSNLCLHWAADPGAAIQEWQRVIRPDGLVMFTVFGVDTLAELRAQGAELMRFNDMHDIGDALVSAGFADPVMDMSQLTLTYADPKRLLADLRLLGGNALAARAPGLRSRAQHTAWLSGMLQARDTQGQLSLTFEICHGHAWCPAKKRLPGGLQPVEFKPQPRKSASE